MNITSLFDRLILSPDDAADAELITAFIATVKEEGTIQISPNKSEGITYCSGSKHRRR